MYDDFLVVSGYGKFMTAKCQGEPGLLGGQWSVIFHFLP